MNNDNRSNEVELMRHSFAHVLAMAVSRVFKNVKLGIGPAVEDGFYHDFQFEKPIGIDELRIIENEIKKIIEEELPFQRIVVSKENAFDILHLQGQIFKTEILSQIKDNEVTFYKTGQEFMDLCRGPHVEHTGKLGAFRLTGISGVYWNGDESRPLMQRIHGIAFLTQPDLDEYLNIKAELANRDHRKIGQQMGYFTFLSESGGGFPIWLPKGFKIKDNIVQFVKTQHQKIGCKYVETPIVSKISPENNHEFTFPPILLDNDEYFLSENRFNIFLDIFKSQKHSYRHLPYKLSEINKVFRYEKSGELNGFTKVREFNLDSNTSITTKDNLQEQLIITLETIANILTSFGLDDFRVELAMPSNNWVWNTNQKDWLKFQNLLAESGKRAKLIIHEAPGSASKIGPSINFIYKDVRGREWKLGYLVIDVNAPSKNKLSYIDSANKKMKPMVFHWSSVGSIERFFALLVEKYAGAFPIWLSPVSTNIIPISEKFNEYAIQVYDSLIENNINSEVDLSTDTMQNKIRESQKLMIPYMLIIGEKEESTKTVSVRPRSGQDLGIMKIEEYILKVRQEIQNQINS